MASDPVFIRAFPAALAKDHLQTADDALDNCSFVQHLGHPLSHSPREGSIQSWKSCEYK